MSTLTFNETLNGTTIWGFEDHARCVPAHWTTVIRFFFLNYLAHAFTIWFRPGEKPAEKIFAIMLAFFFPVAGLGRGVDAIYRHAAFQKRFWNGLIGAGTNQYELSTAAGAGALAVLVRERRDNAKRSLSSLTCFALTQRGWDQPEVRIRGRLPTNFNTNVDNSYNGQVLSFQVQGEDFENFQDPPDDLTHARDISGITDLSSEGYRVVELPHELASLIDLPPDSAALKIPRTSNLLVTFVAVLQIGYAAYQLFLVTGDQLERFGYSAFHLTVVPYLVMSLVNLFGNLATPTYPAITLIETSVLNEAQQRGYNFDAALAFIEDANLDRPISKVRRRRNTQGRLADELLASFNDFPEYQVVRHACSPSRRLQSTSSHPPVVATTAIRPPRIKICFEPECEMDHPTFEVPYGLPPSNLRWGAWTFSFSRAILSIIAIALPLVPIIYVGIKYPVPSAWDRRFVLPLWIVAGDLFAFYAAWNRFTDTYIL